MADDSKDDDKEKLKKQIKALEDKIDNLQKPLPERHIEVLEENQKLFRDGVTTRLESMERTSKWFYKYFTFSALALIALGTIFVTIYVNTTSKKVAHEVTEIAEKKIKVALEFNDWYSKGAEEFVAGKYNEAIISFGKALEKEPDDTPAAYTYNYRGTAYSRIERGDDAIKDYDESIRLKPDNPLPYSNKGRALIRNNRWREASNEFIKEIDLYISKEGDKALLDIGKKQLEEDVRNLRIIMGKDIGMDTKESIKKKLKQYELYLESEQKEAIK